MGLSARSLSCWRIPLRMLKKAASSGVPCLRRSGFGRAHVLRVRSARQKGCGLAGRTFLTIPVGCWYRLYIKHLRTMGEKYSTGPICLDRTRVGYDTQRA